jgi:hypothetical protein
MTVALGNVMGKRNFLDLKKLEISDERCVLLFRLEILKGSVESEGEGLAGCLSVWNPV